MINRNNDLTHITYENPLIVDEYIKKRGDAAKLKESQTIDLFAQFVHGKNILDLGCGPGQISYILTEMGFQVIGIDYSQEMIRRAKIFKNTDHPPQFMVGDMRKLKTFFAPHTFDGIWASASLLHLNKSEMETVLQDLFDISKPTVVLYISLKGGQGTHLVTEDIYGKQAPREFTYWEKETFLTLVNKIGFQLLEYHEKEGRLHQGKPTQWHEFFLKKKETQSNFSN